MALPSPSCSPLCESTPKSAPRVTGALGSRMAAPGRSSVRRRARARPAAPYAILCAMSRATSRRVLLLLLAIGAVSAISAWAWRSWMGEPRAALAEARALAPAVALAAERIRVHQTAAGYWPSAVTPGPAFANPGSQVNVFVSAMVVDLVGPVAGEVGLADVATRARAWLGSQIEETGLVRYHGKPGPGPPPEPGCELPPDSDDTALAWRLAPRSEPTLLASALRTIDQYRTADGLYRVWLAPEDTHRCFYGYSGRVLNPPDVAVQMHIHLFLAGHDPEAARRLCDALGPRMADDQIWVYYAVAPLIPRLRELDLARAGCPLRVPDARLRAAAAGASALSRGSRAAAAPAAGRGRARRAPRPPRRPRPARRRRLCRRRAHSPSPVPQRPHRDTSALPLVRRRGIRALAPGVRGRGGSPGRGGPGRLRTALSTAARPARPIGLGRPAAAGARAATPSPWRSPP